jgi:hypothetical protein
MPTKNRKKEKERQETTKKHLPYPSQGLIIQPTPPPKLTHLVRHKVPILINVPFRKGGFVTPKSIGRDLRADINIGGG